MATKIQLGRLEKIDLRNCWSKEGIDFTPWLSQPENLELLGETIGMDLELIETETHVGPFRADILCQEIETNAYVLIENQLEQTDHLHLGQLMTYAAGLDAVHIIWIAKSFNDEHRAALDWLNRITIEGFYFFGIEVELWKIWDSIAAPKFNIVCNPNDWQKIVRTGRDATKSERAAMYQELWSQFLEYMQAEFPDPDIDYPKASGMHWIKFPFNEFRVVLSYAPTKNEFSIYVLFRGEKRAEFFHYVKDDKNNIEKNIGHQFKWIEENDGAGYMFCSVPFDHEVKSSYPGAFEAVGKFINDLRITISDSRNKFLL